MTKREENKMNMYFGIKTLLVQNETTVSSIPVLKEACDKFRVAIDTITACDRKYLSVSAGSTMAKNNAADTLTECCITISNALYVLGRNTGNESLKAECGKSDSSFRRVRDTELSQKADRILELTRANETTLAGFNINQDQIQQFENAINLYKEVLGRKESKHAEARVAREALFDAFDNVDDVLKEDLDSLMELVRIPNPEFYNHYWAARAIKDLGFVKRKTDTAQEQTAPAQA